MTAGIDNADRFRALRELDSTLLVEAAAGTGKTSLLAGRVTLLLASGVAPRNIAAITFTEPAASQLRARVARFADELIGDIVSHDLLPAVADRLSPLEVTALEANRHRLDELTATTIHGFCHSLLCSYAIEANIDPGAQVLDAVQADFEFRTAFERWLSRRLGENARPGDPIAVMAKRDPAEAVETLQNLSKFRREHPGACPVSSDLDQQVDVPFVDSVREFRRWFAGTPAPLETDVLLSQLEQLALFYDGAFAPLPGFERLWDLAHPKRVAAMRRRSFELRTYQQLAVWKKMVGAEVGARLHEEAAAHYARCSEAFRTLLGRIATALVADFSSELDELLNEFKQHKRSAAVLDFDDLLFAARDLLTTHEEVRRQVASKYTHILVDEFQDTDPIQTEILFLIAGEPGETKSWPDRKLKPGSLFMVGDPKQAIYRFRGADVISYMKAREAVERQFPNNILRVRSNFRSREDILKHVNLCFEERLGRQAANYVALDSTLGKAEHGLPCVARVTVELGEQSYVDSIRDQEAKIVADLCARLIGNIRVRHPDGQIRALVPGDIALLAPVGTDIWRYERALENGRLPFVSQAGKSLFRRQESQDVLALARTLADGRDTLALGALLRGPLVGLTEQELLDIVGALPPDADADELPRLTLDTDPALVSHSVAREVLTTLRDLRRRARSTTPFLLLAEALERLRVRPTLAARSADQAARALANLDLLMERARAYSVRGLTELARDLEADWERTKPHDEARPDTRGEAIGVVTVHSSKGLEWPVIILINTASQFRRREPFIFNRRENTLHWMLGDVEPPALADAISIDDKESAEQGERLLYVACTRAMDLLILPQLSRPRPASWAELLDLRQSDLPELSLSTLPVRPVARARAAPNDQTAEKFQDEQIGVNTASKPVRWLRPSEADADRRPPDAALGEELEEVDVEMSTVAGSSVRGILLHKLMEELLTSELQDSAEAVRSRTAVLLDELGARDPFESLDVTEIAGTALRTLSLPAIAARRSDLVPEVGVYSSFDGGEILVSGRADAVAYEKDGAPEAVFDWKSDVAPSDADRRSYRAQLLAYTKAIGASRGAVVYMSLGQVHWIDAA